MEILSLWRNFAHRRQSRETEILQDVDAKIKRQGSTEMMKINLRCSILMILPILPSIRDFFLLTHLMMEMGFKISTNTRNNPSISTLRILIGYYMHIMLRLCFYFHLCEKNTFCGIALSIYRKTHFEMKKQIFRGNYPYI